MFDSLATNPKEQTMSTFSRSATNFADQTADGTTEAIRATKETANEAFDRLSDKVDDVRDQATPILSRLSAQAEAAARRSADAVRETSQQLREKALRATDDTVSYIKDEPVKAVLIAAATGAALMALLSLVSRTRRRG